MYTIQGKYIRDSRKKTIEKFGESNYGCGGCHDHDSGRGEEAGGGGEEGVGFPLESPDG